jgi:hypothetical protein
VQERTPEAVAAPIVRLLESEELRKAMGRRGFERCGERFSIELYADRMNRYYTSLGSLYEIRRG